MSKKILGIGLFHNNAPEGPICNTNGTEEELYINTIPYSPVLFGGDTYINRYTEKNTMLFFNQWLFDFPDGQQYNYMLDQMIPEPKFHCNSQSYDVSNLINEINIFGAVPGNNQGAVPGQGPLPTDFYNLDHRNIKLIVKELTLEFLELKNHSFI